MLGKMRRERAGRAKTVPTGLGGSVHSVSDLSTEVEQPATHPPPAVQTPSTLKKTVHLLRQDANLYLYDMIIL